MNHPQQSDEEGSSLVPLSTVVCDDTDTPAEYQILCCPIEYARSASEVKPLPPSTTPLAVEEGASPTRSKESIGHFRQPSREASANDGEQNIIDMQPSSSAETGEEGLESSGRDDTGVAIKPSRTHSSVNSQRGIKQTQSMYKNQSKSFASVQGHDIESGQVDTGAAIRPSRTRSSSQSSSHSSTNSQRGIKQSQSMYKSQSKSFASVQGHDIESEQVDTSIAIRPSHTHSSVKSQGGIEQTRSMYETQSTSFEHVQGHDIATGVAIKSSRSQSSHTHSSHSSVNSQRGIEQPQSMYKSQSKSFANVKDHDNATISFGHCEDQARQSMGHWKKGATIASMCVCVGLCAVLLMVVTMMES